ncbi:MAG: hypothetical protein AB3N28_13245 [Kordiimonas sp.]
MERKTAEQASLDAYEEFLNQKAAASGVVIVGAGSTPTRRLYRHETCGHVEDLPVSYFMQGKQSFCCSECMELYVRSAVDQRTDIEYVRPSSKKIHCRTFVKMKCCGKEVSAWNYELANDHPINCPNCNVFVSPAGPRPTEIGVRWFIPDLQCEEAFARELVKGYDGLSTPMQVAVRAAIENLSVYDGIIRISNAFSLPEGCKRKTLDDALKILVSLGYANYTPGVYQEKPAEYKQTPKLIKLYKQ